MPRANSVQSQTNFSTHTGRGDRAQSGGEVPQRNEPVDPTCSGALGGRFSLGSSQDPNTTREPEELKEELESEDEFTKECRHKGRWINAAICFGVDMQSIFRLGIRCDPENLDVDDDDDDDNMKDQEKIFLLAAYNAMLDFIPRLKSLLPFQNDTDPEYFYKVVNAIQVGCGMARSEAVRRIKENMPRYLAAGQRPVNVGQHWKSSDKSMRGLNDPQFGRLLIPAGDLAEWNLDPDATRAAFSSGILKIKGSEMPVFLYDDYVYNPEDPEEGLFQGPFLVCVLIDILFGSNAVDTKDVKRVEQSRHHCIAEMYNLTSISPQNIAYAAVVARFCLSSRRIWSFKDDCFDYSVFYKAIMMRLEDDEDPWVQLTLAWWNDRVFGNEMGKVEDTVEVDEEWKVFLARRAIRVAEARAERLRESMELAGGTSTLEPHDTGDVDFNASDARHSTPFTPSKSGDGVASTPSSRPNLATAPFTPLSRLSPVIDPTLLNTPDMTLDNSLQAQTPSQEPQTPGEPGPSPSMRRNSSGASSPLSNIPEVAETEGTRQLKRKRQASKTGQPKAKVAPRPKRKSARV